MTEWQSMDTAPRDGTNIQVWFKHDLVPVYVYFISKTYLTANYGDANYMEEGWYYSLMYPFDESLPEGPLGEPLCWSEIPEEPALPPSERETP